MAAPAADRHNARALPRLGFVGVGWIGANRLHAVAESACAQIVAIADIRTEAAHQAARSVAELAPHARVCSFSQLLECDLDGIVIATPSSEHASQTLAALDRQLHVFCQKPLARTRTEVARVIDCARNRDRLLEVDFCYRCVAGVPELRALIRAGGIGEVYAADLTFHNAFGPDKPWFFDARGAGGGCMMDLGIHLVDLLLWALDYPAVERLTRRLYRDGRLLSPPTAELENYAVAELQLTGGATARIACSWHLPAGRDAIIEATFFGTRGALRLRNLRGSFYNFSVEHCQGTRARTLNESSNGWGAIAIHDWVQRVAAGASFDARAERLEHVHEILDAMYGR